MCSAMTGELEKALGEFYDPKNPFQDTKTPAVTTTATSTTTSTTTSMTTSTTTSTETPPATGRIQNTERSSVLDPRVARARASPFYGLVDFIFKQAHGQEPPLPSLPPGLSPRHSEMFRAALKLLQSPDDDINKRKPVLALVSGIVNTLSPIGQQFTFSPLVEEQSRLACLAYESKTVDELRADLQAALYPDPEDPAAMSVESLQKFVYESLSKCVGPRGTRAAREKYLVLKIVSQVLHWLENDVLRRLHRNMCSSARGVTSSTHSLPSLAFAAFLAS
ncbi:MAG: hypothetical protein J3Q66DRAFT_83286 [Benniella sp.]|nr:MAG: hypothetical protein J3Q66DRAFT_83286 [Benniella sp.]